jgi:phosphonate transport system permease protein
MPGPRVQLTAVLFIALVWSILSTRSPGGLPRTDGLSALGEIFSAIFRPDLAPGYLSKVAADAWRTVAFAIAGMSIAIALGVPFGVLASGTLQRDRLSRLGVMAATRGILAALRAVHEIVWAILFVTAFGLSPVAGALAIGVPYAGILGRVLAERLQDVPEAPLEAMRVSGASELEVLLYGRFPMAAADMVSYSFYRLECAARAAAVLSFVGLGGLGFRITTALDDLAFEKVWTAIFALLLIVVGIDLWSAMARRRLVS